MQREEITMDEFEAELDRLHLRRQEIEKRVRGELVEVLEQIVDLKGRYAAAGVR